MAYPTKLTRLDTLAHRIGGVPGSHKGAQPVYPARVPSNWFPVSLPAAAGGSPTNADCQKLLSTLAPILADLVVEQSVLLALSYRTVQNVAVSGSASFTVNGVASTGNSSQFDQDYNFSESVPVDVINKNPALAYDLAFRLAMQAAGRIDSLIAAAAYAGFTTNAAVGAAGGSISNATLTSALAAIGGNGEPPILVIGTNAETNASNTIVTPSVAADSGLLFDNLSNPGTGITYVQTAYGSAPIRVLGSGALGIAGGGSPYWKNLLFSPSALAFATTDMGTSTGAAPQITPSGTVQYATSIAKDPESGTAQLALQLVLGNTGSGNQRVYVNFLGAAIAVNPARGIVVKS